MMHRLFNVATRSFSVCTVRYKWNHVAYARNLDLGRHIYEAFAVQDLIKRYPEWSTDIVHDVAQGLASNDTIHKKLEPKKLNVLDSAIDSNDVFAKLGELRLKDNEDAITNILEEISAKCMSAMSAEDVLLVRKQQHAKCILKNISEQENVNVFVSSTKVNCMYESVALHQGVEISRSKHESLEEAERQACLKVLTQMFPEQFMNYKLENVELPFEDDVYLGTHHNRQREVPLSKKANESFGFAIRGGERKIIRNENYIQLNITTSVFVSQVDDDSPAQKAGLLVGDVLLAVNDHSLKDCTHKQAVTSLRKFSEHEDVNFVVTHNMEELLKFEAEKNFLEREKAKIRSEINSERLGKWHEAKSKVDPEEYLMEEFKHKKRPFQHNKTRKSIRLWDIPFKRR